MTSTNDAPWEDVANGNDYRVLYRDAIAENSALRIALNKTLGTLHDFVDGDWSLGRVEVAQQVSAVVHEVEQSLDAWADSPGSSVPDPAPGPGADVSGGERDGLDKDVPAGLRDAVVLLAGMLDSIDRAWLAIAGDREADAAQLREMIALRIPTIQGLGNRRMLGQVAQLPYDRGRAIRMLRILPEAHSESPPTRLPEQHHQARNV